MCWLDKGIIALESKENINDQLFVFFWVFKSNILPQDWLRQVELYSYMSHTWVRITMRNLIMTYEKISNWCCMELATVRILAFLGDCFLVRFTMTSSFCTVFCKGSGFLCILSQSSQVWIDQSFFIAECKASIKIMPSLKKDLFSHSDKEQLLICGFPQWSDISRSSFRESWLNGDQELGSVSFGP